MIADWLARYRDVGLTGTARHRVRSTYPVVP